MTMPNRLYWFFFVVFTFIVSLPIAWLGLAKADFFYPALHNLIGIDAHIKRFAPRNQLDKLGFEKTSPETRYALFHEIVIAIHNDGKGLEKLSYQNPQLRQTTLLTEAEVIHLQDVAKLINTMKWVVLLLFVVWLSMFLIAYKKRMPVPKLSFVLISFAVMLLVSVLILSFGPEKVFNQLHHWAFPKEHQWFFYYEESLMSTMMKAPFLFGYIAAIWALLSFIFALVILKLLALVWEHSNKKV